MFPLKNKNSVVIFLFLFLFGIGFVMFYQRKESFRPLPYGIGHTCKEDSDCQSKHCKRLYTYVGQQLKVCQS
jgi:hypothetical protein